MIPSLPSAMTVCYCTPMYTYYKCFKLWRRERSDGSPAPPSQVAAGLQTLLWGDGESKVAESQSVRHWRQKGKILNTWGSMPVCHTYTKTTNTKKTMEWLSKIAALSSVWNFKTNKRTNNMFSGTHFRYSALRDSRGSDCTADYRH